MFRPDDQNFIPGISRRDVFITELKYSYSTPVPSGVLVSPGWVAQEDGIYNPVVEFWVGRAGKNWNISWDSVVM